MTHSSVPPCNTLIVYCSCNTLTEYCSTQCTTGLINWVGMTQFIFFSCVWHDPFVRVSTPHLQSTSLTKHCNTLQYTATHCNTKHCNSCVSIPHLQSTATHCNTLQHTAIQSTATAVSPYLTYKALQHTAIHCNTKHCNSCVSIPHLQALSHIPTNVRYSKKTHITHKSI